MSNNPWGIGEGVSCSNEAIAERLNKKPQSVKKKQYGTLKPFKKKEVKFLQPYYFQGGKWHKLGGKKNGRRKSA